MISRREFMRLAGAGAAASSALLSGCGWRAQACRQATPNLFVEGGRPLLVVVQGEDTSAMLRAGLEALGGLDKLAGLGKEVFFRGNYVNAQRYPVTTAPEFVGQLANELKRSGFRRTALFDSHGSELSAKLTPEHYLRKVGALDRCAKDGVEVITRDFFDPDQLVFVRNSKWQGGAPGGVCKGQHEAPLGGGRAVLRSSAGAFCRRHETAAQHRRRARYPGPKRSGFGRRRRGSNREPN